jgi:ArsR family transcriptional regulator, arsenate/arsenite/antimonite-responsive transcriptional repressor / arsenate reductase (thioredoxin)
VGEGLSPPVFVRAAAHPLRWRLLRELAASDRRVTELCRLVGQPQSLVSYHLGRLRADRLVALRRSAADRRSSYYRVDLARCGQLLSAGGGALHPGLRLVAPAPPAKSRRRARVLFLCTGNSARSQMAEALVQRRGDGAVPARSAGSAPKPLHPDAVRAMRARGIDIASHRSKHLDELAGDRFDVVVTLCDRVREVCPEFPGAPELVHWSIPDPSREPDGYAAFERVAVELEERIPFLLQHIDEGS